VEAPDAAGIAAERFVLKGFASGWPLERGLAVHRLVATLREAGIDAVPPQLRLTPPGEGTIVADGDGRLWELSQWRPGAPAAAPSLQQARAALETLARIHVAASGLDGGRENLVGPPPAWGRRVEALHAVLERGWDRPASPGGEWADRSPLQVAVAERQRAAAAILRACGGGSLLARWATITPPAVPLQWVLRDIWQAHVLFHGDNLSAVIDLHSSGIDSPATDLARLLGSGELRGASASAGGGLTVVWQEALAAYAAIRPLSAEEVALADLLHVTGIVGGLEHWFRWVLVENRQFHDPSAVLTRVDFLLKHLDAIARETG